MIKKLFISALLTIVGGSTILAQTNAFSGYFLDNFLYRYQMNPALGNDNNFFGFPGLGNLSVGTAGTLSLSKIIYPYNGRTVLFLNPNLPDSEIKKFSNSNNLGVNLRENILAGGFKAFGGYNTISISAVVNSQAGVPGSLLNMLREGIRNDSYDIKNFNIYANSYAEIALNHSREIKQVPGLRVGATFKFLVGFVNAYGKFKRADMNLGVDSWDITSEADVYLSAKGMSWETDYNSHNKREFVSGIETNNPGSPNGYGAAVDLGATYKWKDFNFSLAILNLGGITWNETQRASTNGEQTFQSSKNTFVVNGEEDTWTQVKGEIAALYQVQPVEDSHKRSTMQGTTMNIGVEYELPYYRNLTFGLLNTTRMSGGYHFTEFRLSANVMPVKYISASANLVCGTYGVGFGWLLNVSSGKGINLFLGMDRVPGKLAKQGVPLNSNINVNFGLNFPF